MIVNIRKLKEAKEYLWNIDNTPFEKIIWTDGEYNELTVNPLEIEDWKFIGLNNSDYPEYVTEPFTEKVE